MLSFSGSYRFVAIAASSDKRIFAFKKLFIPIEYNALHWFQSMVDMETKKIQIYDSLRKERDQRCRTYLQIVYQFIDEAHLLEKGRRMTEEEKAGWTLEIVERVPFQTNGK